jgi:16S rRNA processing protein RimM
VIRRQAGRGSVASHAAPPVGEAHDVVGHHRHIRPICIALRAGMTGTSADRVLVGRFGAPHGVRGELRLKSFTGDPAAIRSYSPLTDADGARRFKITALRVIKDDMCVVRVEGIGDRDAAETLTNLELFVPRAQLPPPDEDEFYQADLIGLSAITEAGELLGAVERVLNFGAGDILEIRPSAGGETLLVPFTKAAVPLVNLTAKNVVVILPEEIDGEDKA